MSADIAGLIRSVESAGGRVYAKAERLRVEAAEPLPSDVIAKLKAEVSAALAEENAREYFAERVLGVQRYRVTETSEDIQGAG